MKVEICRLSAGEIMRAMEGSMNFLHVSDLHIGKKLCGKSLMDDQRHILAEIL